MRPVDSWVVDYSKNKPKEVCTPNAVTRKSNRDHGLETVGDTEFESVTSAV